MTEMELTPSFIARHDIGADQDYLQERLQAAEHHFEVGLEYAIRRPINVSSMFNRALGAVGYRAVLSPGDPLLQRDLIRAARCAAAFTRMMGPGDEPVILDLGDGRKIAIPHTTSESFSVADLMDALYAAIISRDTASIETLCQVAPRRLRPPGSFCENYVFTWVEFLQAVLTKSPEAGEKLIQAVDESEPSGLNPALIDYALFISVGEIEAFYGLSSPSAEIFNQKLATALKWHRRYYEAVLANDESQRTEPKGFVALGLLAACALAHDHGRRITVASDYIPAALIEGRFV